MSLKRIRVFGFLILSILAAFLILQKRTQPFQEKSRKTVRLQFTARNKTGDFLKQSEIILAVPRKTSASHKLGELKIREPFTIVGDEFGNQAAKVILDIPPYGTRIIHIEAEVIFPGDENLLKDKFLEEEPGLEISAPEIEELSKTFSGLPARLTAIAGVKWIRENIKDEGYVSKDRGAREALRLKSGDCTEFAAILVTILRSNKIPARMIGGFDSAGKLQADKYHNWVEYFDSDRWNAIDPYNGIEDPKSYIAFRVISKSATGPLSSSQKFLSFDPRLEVEMN